MVKLNKIGIPILTVAMSLGVMSVGSAETIDKPFANNLQIEVAKADNIISKNEVVKKFKELFPNEFNFLTMEDFYLNTGHYYPEDETIRYDLSFTKLVQGKDVYGSATFKGDNLELESFHFEPVNKTDALFPAKITKEEAQKIAQDFMKKFAGGKQYKLDKNNNEYYYYYSNQLLTEPIRYYFSFIRTENNIEIADQRMEVAVLGNGDIVQYSQYQTSDGKGSFEKAENLLNEKELLSKIKENMNLQLQYQVNYDFRSDKPNVQLVYTPVTQFTGINAITGLWHTNNGFTENLPNNPKVEKLTQQPLKPRQEAITVEDAKEVAEKLLAIDSEEVKLKFDSIDERTNRDGKETISINYTYEYRNGGYGTSLDLDKQTGEIIQYHNIKNEVLMQVGQKTNDDKKITSDEALSKAIDYLKEWVPSTLHNYIKPIAEPYTDENYGVYNFTFPRIVNGIVVAGNDISIGINFDGSLSSLYINALELEQWPTTDGILSKEEAEKILDEALNVKLQYAKENSQEQTEHYSLLYTPIFNEKSSTSIDAISGEWTSIFGVAEYPIVTDDVAEEELNYLIQNNILEIDEDSFNADSPVTRGEALNVLLKSISYVYERDYPQQVEAHQTFKDIGPDNPYYQVVEQAVRMGIVDSEKGNFMSSEKITREELAVWYIRAIGLEQAAKHMEVYQLNNIKDAKDVTYKGYVALANAMGIIPSQNGLFNPKKSVTYSELAISTIQLAHKVHENGNANRYY
ncbi:YcdB/YcdC domain-containing protein [Ureibacillus aquaedulcis]|uniref:S-layer homology domain-containing protein n=1 Tax=Ureibacillus aquaedulcis TaxID=3058421 RepID=A0ABT8GUD5_9BACL|nr:YcdB/YcdC domain-containing protein [Ureibacillus sp. BA0131]MDN4494956.1 S-layer homology domain-containing protein [Ureibacillus sp. BA0131]